MTNYTSIATCAATGENVAQKLPVVDGVVRSALAKPQEYLGLDSDWDQRRAFEWGYLGEIARRNGDAEMADYCASRVAELKDAARRTG